MSKIFKNLIPYWRWIILIFVFLIAQAYCDLALPAYTSDIIDVGIQDHGIEHILPKEITSEDYQMAQTFMLSDEKEKFTDCYEAQDASKSDDSVAKYKLTADSDTLDKLDAELLVPLVMAYQAFQSGEQMDVDASAIPQGVALDDNMIKQIRSKVQEKIDAVGSATLKSMGVTFATKCDENAGIDVDANQVAYLWKAGAKMAAFAAIMLIAACVVGFAASKVGAAVGRDLREKTFSKVVGFSNAEINKFSTASLITRSTNDIQQIQMVTTMMLRMVLYAPIVGIGGIIKVAQTKSGMEWVIAIAVAAIMVFIFTLVGIAMPKFKIDPYLRPLYDALYQIMGAESFQRNMEKGLIEVAPLAYMRGRTLDNAFIILDEAQNTTPAQMKMFLTRIGFGSKVVVTGDATQKDLAPGAKSGLDVALRVLKKIDDIGICNLTSKDVVRHPLVQKIVQAYDDYENKQTAKTARKQRKSNK